MRYVLILLFFSYLLTLALSRPPGYEDQPNDSETEELEYEGDDDAADDSEEDGVEEKEAARANFEANQGSNYRFFGQKSEETKQKANLNSLNISDIQVPAQQSDDESTNPENDGQYEHNRRSSGEYSEQNNDANDQQETSQHFPNRDVSNYKASRYNDANNERKVKKRTEEEERAAQGTLLFQRHHNKAEYNNQDEPSEQSHGLRKQDFNAMNAEHRDSRLGNGNYDDVNYYRERRDLRRQDNVSNPEEVKSTSDVSSEDEDSAIKRHDSRLGNRNHENINYYRDRRHVRRQENVTNSDEEKSASELSNEDEESAIKRHVKKLSPEEYEQLLSSLSDEKRILLKKIMDSDSGVESGYDNIDNIKKREVTKKTGAAEENMDSAQIDISKIVSALPAMDVSSESTSATDTTESNKQTETETKSTEAPAAVDTKAEIVTRSDDAKEVKSETTTSEPKSDATINVSSDNDAQVTQKSANKREVNIEDFNDAAEVVGNAMDYSADLTDSDIANDQGYLSELEEELTNEKSEQNYNNIHKRAASMQNDTTFADSMQSLEDSFPNPNAYDDADPYMGSKMAPLVRVKRAKKNADLVIKKRAAGVLPDAKVAFFPDRAETEDEDNEEANEFENEGFYDHYSGNNERSEDDSAESERVLSSDHHSKSNNVAPSNKNAIVHSNNDAVENDNVNIGSDTDSVLSGAEGVDDNLMFSNMARDRRSEDANKNSEINEYNRETEEASKVNDRHHDLSEMSANNYQVNDAFGPVPRNFEGELSRYKRVRRVKHVPSRSNS